MNGLVKQIEKMKPFFEKVSRNIYLRAIKDGFIAGMPVIIFSSIFMLIAFVPNIWGFHWDPKIEAIIVKPYSYTMGILGLLVAGTTAKNLTDSFNRDLPATTQINNIATLITAIMGFLLLSSDPVKDGFGSSHLGTSGLLSGFIAAFITVNIYKFFIKRNITIRMPEEVPPNIAQTFKDIFPLSASIMVMYAIDLLIRQLTGGNFATAVIQLFQPLFSAADGYLGLAIIYGAMAMFWFIGIHGPSIVEPAVSAIMLLNIDKNIALIGDGQQATHLITPGLQYFVVTMGGTGATLVVPFMFMFLAKSKQNKAIGRAAAVPTFFGVNEPILFGAPLVLNPVFMVPFILTPIFNVWIFKFFVEFLGMNSFSYVLPWTTPGPLGLVLGTGFAGLSFVLAIVLIVFDIMMYYPFLKVYDNQILAEEKSKHEVIQEVATEIVEEEVKNQQSPNNASDLTEFEGVSKKVLVLCAGGGTSGLLSNALNKAATEYNVDISSSAGAYGAHQDILKEYDLVVLAPQVASNYEDIKKDTDRLGIKVTKTEGMEYISLTRDPKGSLEYVLKQFKD